jgi:hypothetical protein
MKRVTSTVFVSELPIRDPLLRINTHGLLRDGLKVSFILSPHTVIKFHIHRTIITFPYWDIFYTVYYNLYSVIIN